MDGGWLDWLLGLRDLSLGDGADGDVGLRLAVDLPAWGWAMITLAVGGFGWGMYRRLMGGAGWRLGLAAVRALAVLWVVVLLCGPEAVRREERVEPDVLVMLVDRSASLGVEDQEVVGGSPGMSPSGFTERVSREVALREALVTQWSGVAAGLDETREVRWLGFGERVFGLGQADQAEPDPEMRSPGFGVALGDADQMGTRLRTAVEEAVRRVAGRPVAGVVVLSDGRSGEAVSSGLIARLGQSAVRVLAVPLGAASGGIDVAVVRADGPARAFAGDVVPVVVGVEVRGGEQRDEGAEAVRVRLVDTRGTEDPADDATLDERVVRGEALRRPVRLEANDAQAGEQAWAVEAGLVAEATRPETNLGLRRELNAANNRAELSVEVVDRPVRVLYVEGTPRWEYRYLKNLLVRETSIDSSVLLLSADADFAQEGDTPITRLPADAEEWGRYDVVVLGDVPAAFFGEEQVEHLRERVGRAGAGMLWIGGPGYTPSSWAGTRLADLLPMTQPGSVVAWVDAAVNVEPTGLSGALGVLALGDEDIQVGTEEGEAARWPEGLAPLRWVQDVGGLKPTAEVLALGRPGRAATAVSDDGLSSSVETGELPVVTRMRYGAGQSVYVATDETWRWRRGIGERFPERFYVQLIRMLGRGALEVDDARVRLLASASRVAEGGSVVLDLVVDDAALLPAEVEDVPVRIETVGDAGGGAGFELLLRKVENDAEASGSADGSRRFSAVWTADRSGVFVIRATHPALEPLGVAAELEVAASDDELRNHEADHAKLARLAEATGGAVIPLDDLARLADPDVVPSVARRIADDRTESLVHSPLAFALLIGLLALEWGLRRAIRLA